LGPHPRKLVVRTFDRAPSRYTAKVQAKITAQPPPPAPSSPKPEKSADLRKLSIAKQRQRRKACLTALGCVDEISTDDVFAIPLRNRA
jgi:hypothetical protein